MWTSVKDNNVLFNKPDKNNKDNLWDASHEINTGVKGSRQQNVSS